MRRRFRGIILLVLAAWMGGLTYLVVKHPEFFLGERAVAQPKQVAPVETPTEPQETKAPEKRETAIAVSAVDKIEWGKTIGQLLAEGAESGQAMFKAKPYPTALLHEDFIKFDELETYSDQILMVDLYKDKPLLKYKLHRNQERLIEERTEEGHRAMAVKVDEVVGVSGYIKPYSRVDVLVTLRRKPPETRTVLRNVLVLAAGPRVDRAEASLTDQLKGEKSEKEKRSDVRVVTLQVSPEQAEKLALASSEGTLRLALRNPLDKVDGDSRGVTLRTLLSKESGGKRSPSKKVVVIKGSKVETQFFR